MEFLFSLKELIRFFVCFAKNKTNKKIINSEKNKTFSLYKCPPSPPNSCSQTLEAKLMLYNSNAPLVYNLPCLFPFLTVNFRSMNLKKALLKNLCKRIVLFPLFLHLADLIRLHKGRTRTKDQTFPPWV